MDEPARGATQSAYRILVASRATANPASSAILWDSGRVESAEQAFVPYAGPPLASDATYFWTVQLWDGSGRAGPFAAPARFETGLDDADWVAQWIRRAPAGAQEPDEYTFARTEVLLGPSRVTRARAHVSASHQYELHVNGTVAGRGPSFCYPDDQYYQTLDVTDLLRPGADNAIGIIHHWYGPGKGRPASAPGLILQLSVEHADGSREVVISDGSWKVARAPWIPGRQRNLDSGDYIETLDGSAWPLGWDEPGFDDRSWATATVRGRHPAPPFTHLIAQRTRIVEEPVAPVSLVKLASGAWVADFGRVYAAVPAVSFHHGVGGRTVEMHGGFLLDADGSVSTSRGVQQTNMTFGYVERDGEQTFRAFVYLGFRYLEIDDPGEELGADDVRLWVRHDEVPDEDAATFSSSEPTLDAVFELARHSALFGSQEQFIDTPTREKGPFLRDAFNISQTAMRAFGEQNLTRQVLLEMAQSQARFWPDGRLNAVYPGGEGARDIPDYTEIYPEWVWRYFENTGDRGLLGELYPVLVNVADYVARYIDPATGLVENLAGGGDGDYQYGIVDWPPAMRYGYDFDTAVRTAVNVLGVDAFRRTGDVAAALERPAAEVSVQRDRERSLTAAINLRLTRSDGVYIDGLHPDGGQSAHASQQANAEALAFGLVPADRVSAVGGQVASLGMAMGPMTVESLLRALDSAGRGDDLVALLTNAGQAGWANILARGGTFTWEAWDPSDIEGDSMSHGWGATVLVVMQEALLGVRPLASGWAQLEVTPPPAALSSVAGRVPTPRGPVSVAWQQPAGAVALELGVPANASAVVRIPASGPDVVLEGRRPATAAPGVQYLGMDGAAAVFAVGAGSYSFTAVRNGRLRSSGADVPARRALSTAAPSSAERKRSSQSTG